MTSSGTLPAQNGGCKTEHGTMKDANSGGRAAKRIGTEEPRDTYTAAPKAIGAGHRALQKGGPAVPMPIFGRK
jgi:hypothetical protein